MIVSSIHYTGNIIDNKSILGVIVICLRVQKEVRDLIETQPVLSVIDCKERRHKKKRVGT